MLTLLNKNNVNHIKRCCNYIDNKYVIHYISINLKILFVSVYLPPFKKKDEKADNLRIRLINKIYRDLSTLINFSKFINYLLLIYGFFNAWIKELIGDALDNYNGITKFMPFINDHNLVIRNPRNIKTCITPNGASIVDYIITDNHNDWETLYNLKIKISNIKFYCKNKKFSNHKPLIINISVNSEKLKNIKYKDKSLKKNNFTINVPKYKCKITKDTVLLHNARKYLIKQIKENNVFNNLLKIDLSNVNVKDIRYSLKKQYINQLYNEFNFMVNKSLIYNDCIIQIRNNKIVNNDSLINHEMNQLLDEYEKEIEQNGNQEKIDDIELRLKNHSEKLIQLKHEHFINTAHHYNKNNLEKQLFKHFDDNYSNDAIIKYKGKYLFSDLDVIQNSMDCVNDLIGKSKTLRSIKNENFVLNQIINKTYCTDHVPFNKFLIF